MQVNQKVLDWAQQNPQYKDYLDNYPLIAALYAENNMAHTVEDAIDASKAELTLIVISEYETKPQKFCRNCKRMKCQCQGEPDFEELRGRTYKAGDKTGILKVKFAPWYKGEYPEVNKVYVFNGTVKDDSKYGKELGVSAFKAVASVAGTTPTPNSVGTDGAMAKAVQFATNFLKLRDGIANFEKFKAAMTKEGHGSLIDAVVANMKLAIDHSPNGDMVSVPAGV